MLQYVNLFAIGVPLACGIPVAGDDGVASPVAVSFEVVGALDGIKDGPYRIGGLNRMFVIDNEWDVRRYRLVIPDLPEIDPTDEMLIVLLSWHTRERSLGSITIDRDTMTLRVDQPPPSQPPSMEYRPPKFIVARTKAWDGHICFMLNGEDHHMIWKGDALVDESTLLWHEILRLYNRGEPTREQSLAYWRENHYRNPNLSDGEILARTRSYTITNRKSFYSWLFRDLADMRATPIVPEMFALVEAMEQHDPAFSAVVSTLTAIGGDAVVDGCRHALRSPNPESRRLAIGVLRHLGLPEFRKLAYVALYDDHESVSRNALGILLQLGLDEADVQRLLDFVLDQEESLSSPDVLGSVIYQLGELGTHARPAINALERLTHHRHRGLRRRATEALEKIWADIE